jgi:predicted nucleic acid-binding protein
VVDSSGWIEYFIDGPAAGSFAKYLANPAEILTPTLVLFEVYKIVRRERGEEQALVAAAKLQQTRLVPLTATIALTAADLGLEHRLALADSVVYATATVHEAELVTGDEDFKGLPHVIYIPIGAPGPRSGRT